MTTEALREFLDIKVAQYHHAGFLETDPLRIPHGFEQREDVEIAAFLTASIAWGTRKSILANALKMMRLMDLAPYEFTMNHRDSDLRPLLSFVHRTFNGADLCCFIKGLKHMYAVHGGMEKVFAAHATAQTLQPAISAFRQRFFEPPHPLRTTKHIADPGRGSAAKRINMFLRWMVRDKSGGVDLGLWKSLSPAALSCPLDVHSGKVARKLGLLGRKQNDARAVEELDISLRNLDAEDPVKYDFALFGLGAFEKW